MYADFRRRENICQFDNDMTTPKTTTTTVANLIYFRLGCSWSLPAPSWCSLWCFSFLLLPLRRKDKRLTDIRSIIIHTNFLTAYSMKKVNSMKICKQFHNIHKLSYMCTKTVLVLNNAIFSLFRVSLSSFWLNDNCNNVLNNHKLSCFSLS